MTFALEPYLAASLVIGAICGFESRLAGGRLAVATHIVAAMIGFYGLPQAETAQQGGAMFIALFMLGALFLAFAWAADSDALQDEDSRPGADAANHVVALVVGLACAMHCVSLLLGACAVMFAAFLRRAQAGCEPAYSDSVGRSSAGSRS